LPRLKVGQELAVLCYVGFRPRCYRLRYLNIRRLNYLWTIRHSSARITGNLIT
jgi:hypothetical protein